MIMQWIWSLVLIGGLIFIHELGHFLAAKWMGVKVEEFSIGFPPRLVSKIVNGTRYSFSLLFFGGYVRLRGQNIEDENPTEPGNYAGKSVGARFIILIAGIFFNAVLAWALLAYVFMAGDKTPVFSFLPAVIESVEKGSLAYKLGVQPGDELVSLNRQKIARWQDFSNLSQINENNTLVLKRAGQTVNLPFSQTDLLASQGFGWEPKVPAIVGEALHNYPAFEAGLKPGDIILTVNEQVVDSFGSLSTLINASGGQALQLNIFRPKLALEAPDLAFYLTWDAYAASHSPRTLLDAAAEKPFSGDVLTLGFKPKLEEGRYKIGIAPPTILEKHGLLTSVGLAGKRLVQSSETLVHFLAKLVSGKVNKNEVGGPLQVFRMVAASTDQGLNSILFLVAMISFQLAFFNLLPIPALDGGHILLLVYELIIRRSPTPKVRMRIQMVGVVFLLSLMVFLTWQDLTRL